MSEKVVIITGASRGIGSAIARYLLKEGHKVFLVARTAEPLESLEKEFKGQVAIFAGDLGDLKIGPEVISLALAAFSRIDALIINHGSLSPLKKIADSTPEEWRSLYDVNFFSAISLIQPALPPLRATKGRIILTSSGAAASPYSTWGAYGSSKAAMNHLASTLSVEEPEVISIAIRPGTVDTEMQKEIRVQGDGVMDSKDFKKFKGLYEDGRLLKPEQPGNVMARLATGGDKSLSGRFLTWNDKELDNYQDV